MYPSCQVREYLREKEEQRLVQAQTIMGAGLAGPMSAMVPYPRAVSPRMLMRPGSPSGMPRGLTGPVTLQPAYPAHYGLPGGNG